MKTSKYFIGSRVRVKKLPPEDCYFAPLRAAGKVVEFFPQRRGHPAVVRVEWDKPHFVRRGSQDQLQVFGIRQSCLEAEPAVALAGALPPLPVGLGETVNQQHADAVRLSKEACALPPDAQFFIRPTYTPGSVALVDRFTAASVAALELVNYRRRLSDPPEMDTAFARGVMAGRREHALARGLVGIVTAHWRAGRRFVFDFLTGETSVEK